MPNLTADRVKETTTTTGTGTITLAGAVAQFRSFASAFADGNVVQYAIVGQTGTEWEVGNGTFTASGTTLARTTVLASSNAGAAVNFSAGTKDVFATATAAHILAAALGPASALDNGLARYDGTTGKLLQDGSLIKVSDATGATNINIKNINGTLTLQDDTPNTSNIQVNSQSWVVAGGNRVAVLAPSRFSVASDYQIGFSSSSTEAYTIDTATGRQAAGVVKGTDGSTGIRWLQGGGAAVASAAALPVPTGRVFHVTGTTGITSITSTNFQAGVAITMIFDGVLTVTDGGNLKLAGNFVTAADSTLSLVYDGTNWFETSRSTN